jgi:cation:H+ antiporter
VTAGLFLFAAAAILASAEPFAEGLVTIGRSLHIEEFLLVQWLAPLASEAPEFLVATLFALRGQAQMGLRTLVSSKVNQWTLLVGTLPLVYSISAMAAGSLVLDARQTEEVLLTAGQSFFALVIIANLSVSYWQAFTLLALFSVQLAIPLPEARYAFSGIYLVLGIGILIRDGQRRGMLFESIRQLGTDVLGRENNSRVA